MRSISLLQNTEAESSVADNAIARCIVFGGGLNASPLQALCRESVLDLMLTRGKSVLEHVVDRVAELSLRSARPLDVQVVYGKPVPEPTLPAVPAGLSVSVVAETQRWRGPAGLLRDLCGDLSDDALILVMEGARWYGAPVLPCLAQHLHRTPDATIAACPDSTPAGLYVLRRSVLDLVPEVGFLDLKEQLIGRLLEKQRPLHVHTLDRPGAVPLRTLSGFLATARAAAGAPSEWSLVDPGATVDHSAMILSSVVMRGARVKSGALVARSLVLEGGVVESGAEVVDSIVQQGGTRRAIGDFRSMRASKEYR